MSPARKRLFANDPHAALLHALTDYDRKQAAKPGMHNPYALPQYMRRLTEVQELVDGGATWRNALTRGFSGRLLDVCLRAIGEPKSTAEEQRSGRWMFA